MKSFLKSCTTLGVVAGVSVLPASAEMLTAIGEGRAN